MNAKESKKQRPFFTVVIPSYNCHDFLRKALESVLNQSFQDFEIIVIDNSSTDGTALMVEKNDDPRLSFVQVENRGVIALSRNVGIKMARGEWICFLDADDVWLPNKLETVYNSIAENPSAILFTHSVWLVVDGKRRKILGCSPSVSNAYENLLFDKNTIYTSAVTIRKDIADQTKGFSEKKDFVTVEDLEYWIRLSQVGEFCFIDKSLGEWNIHGNNSSNNSELRAKAFRSVREHHLTLWSNKHPQRRILLRRCRGQIESGAGRILLRGGEFAKARGFARAAISHDPLNWKAWAVIFLSLFRIKIKNNR